MGLPEVGKLAVARAEGKSRRPSRSGAVGPEARHSLKLGFVDFWMKGQIFAFCEYFPLLEEDSRHAILVQSELWPPFDARLEVG